MPYKKKPKVLRRSNIKKKTGNKQQSKQIMALTRQMNSLTKTTSTRFCTVWQRNILPIDTTIPTGKAYVCPMPYAPCNPFVSTQTGSSRLFSDNLAIASQPSFFKNMLFQAPVSIKNCSKIYCNGGTIKWQMNSIEPAYSKVTLALIQPRRQEADQITNNRGLKGVSGAGPGSAANLVYDVDYTCHDGSGGSGAPSTYFGTLFNKKLWRVHYYREVAFSSPGSPSAPDVNPDIEPANTSPKNNAVIATGSIRLPKGKMIQNRLLRSDGATNQTTNAIETGFTDSRNEDECYLVAIQNGASADGETINLGFRVLNYYTALN